MTVEEAINYFGSGIKLTKALGITRTNCSHWKTKGNIPIIEQYRIERLTQGKLKATDHSIDKIKQ